MKIPEILQSLIDEEYVEGTSDKDLEDVLGPNYRTLINFWIWIENNFNSQRLTFSQKEAIVADNLWVELDNVYEDFVDRIQWELTGDNFIEETTYQFVDDKFNETDVIFRLRMTGLISNCACEIIAMDKIIESKWDFHFLPFLMKIRVDG